MSRPLRIEYPGAWHHVMNRGRRREDIYNERSDGFIDICKDYNLKKYSSASSIVENVKKKLLKDRKFRNMVNKLSRELIKNQPET